MNAAAHPPGCICTELVAVTERSAMAAGRLLGKGDGPAADEAASAAMVAALGSLPISGRIVIGRPSRATARGRQRAGSGGRPLDLALDPVEGPAVVARGGVGALSIIAAGDPDSMTAMPRMYMKKMAVGPVGEGPYRPARSVSENLEAIADAFGRGSPTSPRSCSTGPAMRT